MALDGKSFFYVNPLEVLPEACHKDERKFHVKPIRQKWFGCACCPPNLARILSSIGSYAYTENENTLFIHLYMGSTVTKTVNDKGVMVKVDSKFPWSGDVKVKVNAKDTDFVLALRIPDWCDSYEIDACYRECMEEKDGYLYIKKTWAEEEVISLSFPMEVKIMASDAKIRENIGKVAIERGPIVYCLEEADNGKDLHLLSIDPSAEAAVEEMEVCGERVNSVSIAGFRECKENNTKVVESTTIYGRYVPIKKENVTLKFVPYYTWANRGENEMQVWVRV